MDKKKYLTPLMEIEEVEMIAFMVSMSGGDPTFNESWGGEGSDEIEWPEDE